MDSYIPLESPAQAYRDRSRLVLLPAAVLAWTIGALLLLASASALVTVIVAASTGTVTGLTLHTMTALPPNAVALTRGGGPSVVDGTSPVMTAVQVSASGLSGFSATALRLAPTLELATFGVVSVLVGLVISRIGSRTTASRLLLAATLILIGGSVAGQIAGALGALGVPSVSWTGIPQLERIPSTWTAAVDPAPLAVGAAMLVVVHLLRRLEGAGVLTARGSARSRS